MAAKILFVEDNEAISDVTSTLLTKKGYRVTLALNGQEGLMLFNKWQFDLIITDIFMPVMDGNQFITELAKYSNLPPIIALSYNIFDVISNPIITLVATKPMTTQVLLDNVSKVLNTNKPDRFDGLWSRY